MSQSDHPDLTAREMQRIEALFDATLYPDSVRDGELVWSLGAAAVGSYGEMLKQLNQQMRTGDRPMNALSIACEANDGTLKMAHLHPLVDHSRRVFELTAPAVAQGKDNGFEDEIIVLKTMPNRGVYIFFQDTGCGKVFLCPPHRHWDILRADIPGDPGEVLELLDAAYSANGAGTGAISQMSPHHWQEGIAGQANIITFNGEDVRGVARVEDRRLRQTLIEAHNRVVDQLLEKKP